MRYELTRTSGYGDAESIEEVLDNVRPPKQWQYRCSVAALSALTDDQRAEYRMYITLHTLEELEAFQRDCKSLVIIGRNSIEIYDNWRE